MSTENPTPPTPEHPVAPEPYPAETGQPAVPNYQQPVYQQPVYQQQYAPRPARAPLTPRAKTGAAWAGIIGFNLLTLGFFLFIVPLALLLIGGVIALAMQNATQAELGPEVVDFLTRFDPSMWVVPLLVVSGIGLVLMILALVISKSILRRTGAKSPWGITWAAAGIAIVVYWIVSIIGSFVWGLIGGLISGTAGSPTDLIGGQLVTGVIGLVVAIIVNSVIGWLCWLWMAHAMRPDVVSTDPAQ